MMAPALLLVLAGALSPPRDTTAQAPVAYAIEATLDEHAHVLRASERITFRNATGPTLSRLYLHLYPNAFRDARTAYARDDARLVWTMNPLDWIPWGARRGFVTVGSVSVGGRATAFTVHETVMEVPLAKPLGRGEALTIDIVFEVKIPVLQQVVGFRGTNYAMALWYPKLAVPDSAGWRGQQQPTEDEFYTDCSTYDVRITVPHEVVVAATGKLLDTTDNGDGTITRHWQAEHVRFFAWVADRRYRVKRFTWDNVSVEYLYVGRDEPSLDRGVATIRAALDFYGTRYGAYPDRTLVIAETPALGSGIGGVSFSQLVMMPADMRHSLLGASWYEETLAHEIAHQWWGMTVGTRDDADAWLSEGLAEFSGRDLLRHRQEGGGRPARAVARLRRAEYVDQAALGFDRRILQPDSSFDDVGVREVALYAKASFVLEMLQYVVGADTLDNILHTYLARYRYRNVRTADFIAMADSVSGRNLAWFFDEWLTGTATCDYSIEAVHSSPRPGAGYRSVITVRRNGGIVMPVEVKATLEDGSVVRRSWEGGTSEPSGEIVIDAATPVRSAVLDPDRRLLETVRYNNYYPRRVGSSFLPRVPEDEAYHIVHLPFVFYDDGVELGVLLAGGRTPRFIPPTWVQPQHLAAVVAGYNLAGGTPVARLAYASSLGLLGRRALWDVRARRDRTREAASVSARALFGPHFYRGPFHAVGLWLRHERYFAASPQADEGTVNSIELAYSLRALVTDFYPIAGGVLAVDAESGWRSLGSDWSFLRAAGRAAVYHRLLGGTKLALNAFAGTIAAGTAPRQKLLWLTREANFRAAPFDTIAGAHLTAVNGEVRVPVGTGTLLGVAAFVNLAKYWGSGGEAAAGLQSEVGVGLRLLDNAAFGVQLDVPFWTSAGPGTETLDFARLSLRVGRPFHGPGT